MVLATAPLVDSLYYGRARSSLVGSHLLGVKVNQKPVTCTPCNASQHSVTIRPSTAITDTLPTKARTVTAVGVVWSVA